MAQPVLKAAAQRRKNVKDALAFAGDLESQLKMAGLVQRDFLPKQMPHCERLRWAMLFLPAEWVSGDIYDIVRLDEQHIGFYVADVVGHGMPAALLTIFLKQALVMRQTAGNTYHIFEPAEVMTNLNKRLTEQKLSCNQFITCCYCLLNIETLQLTYARAGHPYPLLIRPDQPLQQLEVRGSLLGIFQKADFSQQSIQLQPGDKLLLYSDGAEPFIGSCQEAGDFKFSPDFCETVALPIVDMLEKLENLVQTLDIKPSQIDDITAVALQIL